MAVTSDNFTNTDLQYVIPELWPGLIEEQMFADTVAMDHFLDLSYLGEGHDIINIPDFYTNTYTAQTQSTQGAEITTTAHAGGGAQLTINTHKYLGMVFGNLTRAQIGKNYDVVGVITNQIGSTLKDVVEDALFALWSGLTTNSSGDTATVLTDLEIRNAIQDVENRNANSQKGFKWFFHPTTFWSQVAGIQKIYDASMFGAPSLVKTGGIGRATMSDKGSLYGIPIAVSTNVVAALLTHRNLLAHKNAFCYAFQSPGASKVHVTYTYEPRNLGWLLLADIVYGVKELRDELAVVVNSRLDKTTS